MRQPCPGTCCRLACCRRSCAGCSAEAMLRAVGKLFAPWGKNRKVRGRRKERAWEKEGKIEREIGWVRCDLGGKNRLSARGLRHIQRKETPPHCRVFVVRVSSAVQITSLAPCTRTERGARERGWQEGVMGAGRRTRERRQAVGIENAGVR